MEQYIEIIKEKMNITSLKHNEGQNNVIIIINNDLIFRFPKHKEAIRQLQREVAVLNRIQDKITINIPKPLYHSLDTEVVGETFVSYKMIQGEPLRKSIFSTIQNNKEIAASLATFLKELHQIPINEVKNMDILEIDNYKRFSDMYLKVEKIVFPHIKTKFQDSIKKQFENFLNNDDNFVTKKVLVHGDFGPSNILYDRNNQMVSGIIDFSEIAVDDPAIDFASMIGPFGYGESFLQEFEGIYPEIKIYVNRAKFYASTFALQDALFGYEHNDEEIFQFGITPYLE